MYTMGVGAESDLFWRLGHHMSSQKMLLRTLYLPNETDNLLRLLAFRLNISKGELIRKLVEKGLQSVKDKSPSTDPPELLQQALAIELSE